jgi:transcriptional regulator with XRE-family HTH domain
MAFGDILKRTRQESGYSQQSLAESIGLAQSSIGNYEKNVRQPNLEILLKFSDFFNVSTDYLLGRTGDLVSVGIDSRDITALGDDFFCLLMKNDETKAWLFIEEYLEVYGLDSLLFKLFRYVMTKLGWLWEMGEVSVSREHRFTAFLERLMHRIVIDQPVEGPSVLLMTAPYEKHTFGLKVLSLALKSRGYDTYYIGECVPEEDFLSFYQELKPSVVIISKTLPHHFKEIEPYFNVKSTKILVGMGATGYTKPNVRVLRKYEACLEVIA